MGTESNISGSAGPNAEFLAVLYWRRLEAVFLGALDRLGPKAKFPGMLDRSGNETAGGLVLRDFILSPPE